MHATTWRLLMTTAVAVLQWLDAVIKQGPRAQSWASILRLTEIHKSWWDLHRLLSWSNLQLQYEGTVLVCRNALHYSTLYCTVLECLMRNGSHSNPDGGDTYWNNTYCSYVFVPNAKYSRNQYSSINIVSGRLKLRLLPGQTWELTDFTLFSFTNLTISHRWELLYSQNDRGLP